MGHQTCGYESIAARRNGAPPRGRPISAELRREALVGGFNGTVTSMGKPLAPSSPTFLALEVVGNLEVPFSFSFRGRETASADASAGAMVKESASRSVSMLCLEVQRLIFTIHGLPRGSWTPTHVFRSRRDRKQLLLDADFGPKPRLDRPRTRL